MIKLERISPPPQLTPEKEEELTLQYLADTNARVWNKSYIRARLLSLSHSKCAYCETYVDEESKYMEVEHVRHKAIYNHLVASWGNLLPACKRCNVNKGTHDVEVDGMLMDPTINIPSQHMFMQNYRLYHRDELGEETIAAFYLNESDKLVKPRFEIGTQILATLSDLKLRFEENKNGTEATIKRRVLRGLSAVLAEARPEKQYCATTATIIASSPDFQFLMTELKAAALWDNELEAQYQVVRQYSLL
ncbi:HNH endonuclease [uncultured Agrobacterium sp.]|uniref:HNH endonuclease n=1 Tax=uncultured Agrobacterium sp. TaxID=157277 RepID=UPI00258284A6|nr:HNH endonuclease [uncultured Agrobacterium sp.]